MKDPNSVIRKAYYDLLNGNVTLAGSPVPIYDAIVPTGAGYPRIVFVDQLNSDFSTLSKYGQENDTTIELIVKGKSSYKDLDDIANQVKPILFSNLDLSPDFAQVVTTLASDLSFPLSTEDGKGELVRQITIRNFVQQVNSI